MSGELTEQVFRAPDGTELAYVDVGSGPAIVLIHGWSGSLRWFERNFGPLAENHRVVAFDFRGHGSSEKTESGHTMDQYAQDLHDVIEGLGVERPLMAGWSMGSIVLWNYILQFGRGQASGMVFVGQSASDLITPEYEHGIMTHDDLPEWIHALQTDREPFVRDNMAAMVKNTPTPAEHDWMTNDYLRTPAHIAAVALYCADGAQLDAGVPEDRLPDAGLLRRRSEDVQARARRVAGRAHPRHGARGVRGERPHAHVGGAGEVQRGDRAVLGAAQPGVVDLGACKAMIRSL